MDEKPGAALTPSDATGRPPRVWVDEGWGYQVEQSGQSGSARVEFAPLEYEASPAARLPGRDPPIAAVPATPGVSGPLPQEDSLEMPPVPPSHWTLVDPG